jgi:hypothetical protein
MAALRHQMDWRTAALGRSRQLGQRLGDFVKSRNGEFHQDHPSTQFATINPGTEFATFSASRIKSSRLRNFTCGTSRKIGALTCPRPVFDRDATAVSRVFIRAFSATSRLGPFRR